MRCRPTTVVLALLALSASAAESQSARPNSLLSTVSSCDQWTSVFEAHWMTFPQCHSGASSTPCCELYDLMAKSIRVFNDKFACKFSDNRQYSTKFTAHCTTNRAPSSSEAEKIQSHSSSPIDLLEAPSKTISEHTNTGGGGCIGGDCGGCVGSHCGQHSGCSGGYCGGGCSGSHCGGCSGGYCGGGCSGSHCGGCSGGHCGGGCSSGNCGKPVSVCVGINCGCAKCCIGVNCGSGGGTTDTGTQSGTSNTGSFILPDDDGNVCFHGQGAVRLQNGGVKLMRELAVGDMVHVGQDKFSEVFMFTHQDANKQSTYVNMTVGSGEWIMVTPSHYMYSDKGLQLAGELSQGDTVEMEDGRMEKIVERSLVQDKGLYNPQTTHGDVAVSGFRASTYTKTIQYETAHSLLAPLRALYRICGAHISRAF